MEFKFLENAVIQENAIESVQWKRSIRNDDDENQIEKINRWLTPLMEKKFKAGIIDLETAQKSAIRRIEFYFDKQLKKSLSKLHAVEISDELQSIDISVEWKKNRTWGMNPTATVKAWTKKYNPETGTGTASGCGYDKLSSAIADALNQCPSILRPLYQLADDLHGDQKQYREKIGYGSGYSILPYFESGVGISCYPSIFSKMGYTWKGIASGSTFDVYTVTKK
jgi:hypothetical protein